MACDGPKLVQVLLLLLMVKMFQNLDIRLCGLGSPLSNIKVEVYLVNGIVMLIIQEFRCFYDLSLNSGTSLMTSLRAEGVPRKLVLIAVSWAQLLACTQQPVLSNVTHALPHLAPMKWIPSIRNFLCTIGSRIRVENLPTITLTT